MLSDFHDRIDSTFHFVEIGLVFSVPHRDVDGLARSGSSSMIDSTLVFKWCNSSFDGEPTGNALCVNRGNPFETHRMVERRRHQRYSSPFRMIWNSFPIPTVCSMRMPPSHFGSGARIFRAWKKEPGTYFLAMGAAFVSLPLAHLNLTTKTREGSPFG